MSRAMQGLHLVEGEMISGYEIDRRTRKLIKVT